MVISRKLSLPIHLKHLADMFFYEAMVYIDNFGDRTTRRYCTGYFIWINQSLIGWISKRHPKIESAIFGAEFVTMKNVMESF